MSQFYITGRWLTKWSNAFIKIDMYSIQGGVDDDNQVEDEIKVYQEAGWSTVSYMNFPRYEHAVSLVDFDDVCAD